MLNQAESRDVRKTRQAWRGAAYIGEIVGERPEDHRHSKQAHEDSGKIILHLDLVATGGAAYCKGVAMMGVERRKEVATGGDRRKLFEELEAKTKATMRDIRKRMRIDADEEDGQHLSKKRV